MYKIICSRFEPYLYFHADYNQQLKRTIIFMKEQGSGTCTPGPINSPHFQGNLKPDFNHPSPLAKESYEVLISWSFEVTPFHIPSGAVFSPIAINQMMGKSHLKSSTKALAKVYIDKYLLCSPHSDFNEHRLITFTAMMLAREVNEPQSPVSQKVAQDTLGAAFSDETIIQGRNKLTSVLGKHRVFETPYSYLTTLISYMPEISSTILQQLTDVIDFSLICFELVNAAPKFVFLACVKFVMESSLGLKDGCSASPWGSELFQSPEVRETLAVVTASIAKGG